MVMKKKPQDLSRTGSSDAVVHEAFVPLTHGIALASIVGAYLDWLSHVAASSDKQREMYISAVRKLVAWCKYVSESASGGCELCALPQSHDKRFANSAWAEVPFNWSSQAFLLTEQWWVEAMTNVPGVSVHHEEVAEFVTRQWLDMLSPSNFVASNPEVLRYTLATCGGNLIRGALNWQQDAINLLAQRKPRGTEAVMTQRNLLNSCG
jgi:polyhydroxyalkanoate synthase